MSNEAATRHIAALLRQHQRTTGMAVSTGTTCRCGFWCDRSRGNDLQDHQAAVIVADLMEG